MRTETIIGAVIIATLGTLLGSLKLHHDAVLKAYDLTLRHAALGNGSPFVEQQILDLGCRKGFVGVRAKNASSPRITRSERIELQCLEKWQASIKDRRTDAPECHRGPEGPSGRPVGA